MIAKDPELGGSAIFLQHRRAEHRLDLLFAQPDEPIDALRSELGLRARILGGQ